MMHAQIQERLQDLRNEFEKGQKRLREMQVQQSKLHETLLRIGGAIQVLEELLSENKPEEQPEVRPIEARSISSGPN